MGRHMQHIALFVIRNSEKEGGEDGEDEDDEDEGEGEYEDEGEEGPLEEEGANFNAEPAGGGSAALQQASEGRPS